MPKDNGDTAKPNMFNKAVVFGSVLKPLVRKQTPGGSVYASIQLQCPNALHGDVRVWGKLWGKQVEDALAHLKPGDKIRFEGVVQQYEGKHGRVTNFNFWAYRDCLKNEIDELRAVYTVVGDVIAVETLAGNEDRAEMRCLEISYQSGQEGESQYEPEIYQFCIETTDEIASIIDSDLVGTRIKMSGMLRQLKDYFENEIAVLASIKQIKVLYLNSDDIPF